MKLDIPFFGGSQQDAPKILDLIVKQGSRPRKETQKMFTAINDKLLSALPPARQILEIGCGVGELGARFKLENPGAHWYGVAATRDERQAAAANLDDVFLRDLNRGPLGEVGSGYDCIVLNNTLQLLDDPEALLLSLYDITSADGQILLSVFNNMNASTIERLLLGDLTDEANGSISDVRVKIFTQSSLFKLLLDAGWWPTVVDRSELDHETASISIEALVATATRLGVPTETAHRNLVTYQWIVHCKKVSHRQKLGRTPTAAFSVLVPVNNDAIFKNNVLASPGLREVAAEIVATHGHPTAAAAFREGLERTHGDWIVFCHQDIYFPRGSGFDLANVLGTIKDQNRAVIGVVGIGVDEKGQEYNAGMIVDRLYRYDWPSAKTAVSIDECMVILSRETELLLDDELGWHLWATDLCLQAVSRGFPPARIERLLVFHNSLTEFSLPASYHASAAKLAVKYPEVRRIASLCGEIKNVEALPSSRARRLHLPIPPHLLSFERRMRSWFRSGLTALLSLRKEDGDRKSKW